MTILMAIVILTGVNCFVHRLCVYGERLEKLRLDAKILGVSDEPKQLVSAAAEPKPAAVDDDGYH
jgi:hypothetical protein